MSLQSDKESSGHVKAAIIGGAFALLAALVSGVFLVINTMVDNGVIVFGNGTPIVSATPPPLMLNIRPACGSDYTVEADKAIELHYGGWYAKGLTLGTDNANHLTVTLFIDGQKISGIKQDVQQVTPSWYPGASCGSQDYSDAFGTFYIANIGTLTSGKHSVQVIYSFDKQVTDGVLDDNGNSVYYGPGDLDPLEFTIVASP